jgi:hypothetical protein
MPSPQQSKPSATSYSARRSNDRSEPSRPLWRDFCSVASAAATAGLLHRRNEGPKQESGDELRAPRCGSPFVKAGVNRNGRAPLVLVRCTGLKSARRDARVREDALAQRRRLSPCRRLSHRLRDRASRRREAPDRWSCSVARAGTAPAEALTCSWECGSAVCRGLDLPGLVQSGRRGGSLATGGVGHVQSG